MDLNTFAGRVAKPGQACRTCNLSLALREEIATAREAARPPSWETISRWLKAHHGVTVNASSLRSHHVNNHNPEEVS